MLYSGLVTLPTPRRPPVCRFPACRLPVQSLLKLRPCKLRRLSLLRRMLPPRPAIQRAAPDGRPVIVAFGDSLTAGYGADPGDSYPDYLEKDLNAKGYHYQVINQGISGNTTKDGVDRLQDALRLKPVLVIVAFGGNDGLRGLPIASTRENLDRIVSHAA